MHSSCFEVFAKHSKKFPHIFGHTLYKLIMPPQKQKAPSILQETPYTYKGRCKKEMFWGHMHPLAPIISYQSIYVQAYDNVELVFSNKAHDGWDIFVLSFGDCHGLTCMGKLQQKKPLKSSHHSSLDFAPCLPHAQTMEHFVRCVIFFTFTNLHANCESCVQTLNALNVILFSHP